ncbi:MAG: hydantoinase B/oxoprolinase family protein [Candidatus Sumerlaeia bacterium]|nr:hydantoinase B/oxoprolinase family protein [Candidatus Sumerlaeia bacterium]
MSAADPPAEPSRVPSTSNAACWDIWVDPGGTFTDCLAIDPAGRWHRAKVLSSGALRGTVVAAEGDGRLRVAQSWGAPTDFVAGGLFALAEGDEAAVRVRAFDAESSCVVLESPLARAPRPGEAFEIRLGEEAPVVAARLVTGTPAGRALPPMRLRLATTRGTNALLEGTGVAPVFFVTAGFGDLLEIGTQARPDLFARAIRKPPPLHAAVVEVPERLAADGRVVRPLDLDAIAEACRAHVAAGRRVAAVALLHSYRNAAHERALAAFLRACGFEHVSCSAELAPAISLLPRATTAVVDACLAPVLGRYLAQVARQSGAEASGGLHVMTSAGGLAGTGSFRPKDGLLSGPAGGVVGAVAAARRSGLDRVVAFDMGGTSTDVSRHDGEPSYVFEHRVGHAHLVAPAMAIETVAAGGGSICRFDGRRLLVGPQSAGAAPGPACYGAGGPLTLTDVNLLLGRLDAARFEIPLFPDRAAARFAEVVGEVERAGMLPARAEELLEGFATIANEVMAEAIRRISVREGYDAADYALVSFGGAGGQHACAVAALLGMRRILVPEDASLLSAYGLGHAAVERFAERPVLRPLEAVHGELRAVFVELAGEALTALRAEGVGPNEAVVRQRLIHVRLVGQESSLALDWQAGMDLEAAFGERYAQVYGYVPEAKPLEVETLRVVAASRPRAMESVVAAEPRPATSTGTVRTWLRGQWRDLPAFEWARMQPGDHANGPAIVFDRLTSVLVESGWRFRLDGARALVLDATEGARVVEPSAGGAGAELELFANRFRAIAAEMGEMLRRTAISTNVKERLDFSCAVLDARGDLVVNAPHVPVHLGALAHCVKAVAATLTLEEGDVVVTNHPAFGGSHLPDITVVTPVFAAGELLGYTASRAHHAEIGGMRPGSAPPDATRLEQEGIVIAPTHLVRRGSGRWDEIEALLQSGPWPTRALADNLADLRAAVAANRRGAQALLRLAAAHGAPTVHQMMQALQDLVAAQMAQVLTAWPDGVRTATERLDDGTPLCVRWEKTDARAVLDFAGTGARHAGNLNATPAIVSAAAIYVLRLLAGERFPDLPLNQGLLRALEIRLPHDSILSPDFAREPLPAVIGGNVETSQRLVDTILKALGLAACSQGTMNNVIFGNARFGYYETICGGAGATADAPGADAVHTHMTNTRLTDVEILEHRYPVRVEQFAVRRGSGGAGRHRGGDGVLRVLRFLEDVSLSILSQHRIEAPYGLDGGAPGAVGHQWIERADGTREDLPSIAARDIVAGDQLVLETPGGGGCGECSPESPGRVSIGRMGPI